MGKEKKSARSMKRECKRKRNKDTIKQALGFVEQVRNDKYRGKNKEQERKKGMSIKEPLNKKNIDIETFANTNIYNRVVC